MHPSPKRFHHHSQICRMRQRDERLFIAQALSIAQRDLLARLRFLSQVLEDSEVFFVGEELASSKEEVLGKVAIIEGSDSVVVGLVVADKEDLGVGLGEEICSLLDAIVQLNPSQIPLLNQLPHPNAPPVPAVESVIRAIMARRWGVVDQFLHLHLAQGQMPSVLDGVLHVSVGSFVQNLGSRARCFGQIAHLLWLGASQNTHDAQGLEWKCSPGVEKAACREADL